jgi:hypothetical protein
MSVKTKIQLKADTDSFITTNNNQEITGLIDNGLRTDIIDSMAQVNPAVNYYAVNILGEFGDGHLSQDATDLLVDTGSRMLFSSGYGIDTKVTGGTDILYVGNSNADLVVIGRVGGQVQILGDVTKYDATNAEIKDSLITLNKGGGAGTGSAVGFEIEENSTITGYFKTNAARNGYLMLSPAVAYYAEFLHSSLSANRSYTMPNASGTLALTSDITNYTFSTGLTNTANTITNDVLTGKAGGQTWVGGTAAGEYIILSSTSHATKGSILFGTSYYSELSNKLILISATEQFRSGYDGTTNYWSATTNSTGVTTFKGAGSSGGFKFTNNADAQSLVVASDGSVYNWGAGAVSSNTVYGNLAWGTNTTGFQSTIYGYRAANVNSTGGYITAFGYDALRFSTQDGNAAFGHNALGALATGTYNTSVGTFSMQGRTGGGYNTSSGIGSGGIDTTAIDRSVFYGAYAGAHESTSYKLYIDSINRGSQVLGRNESLIYGKIDASVANQFLVLNGALYLQNSVSDTNYYKGVLVSGVLTWTDTGSTNAPS